MMDGYIVVVGENSGNVEEAIPLVSYFLNLTTLYFDTTSLNLQNSLCEVSPVYVLASGLLYCK